MRLIIDLQGAQSTGSRNRGIGRYTRDLVRAMARSRGEDEVFLLVSTAHGETIPELRVFFKDVLPQDAFRFWTPMPSCSADNDANAARRDVSEIAREAAIRALRPDFVLVSSLFEGHGDDTVASIKRFDPHTPVAVILYDLIPLIYRNIYLSNPSVDRWYTDRLENLMRADLLLAISGSSRMEAIEQLGIDHSKVVNISGAVSEDFIGRLHLPVDSETPARHGLVRPYLMYTGGIDHRKNIEGLIEAYCALPEDVRANRQLAIVCHADAGTRQRLAAHAQALGAALDDVILTGFVSDEDLHDLYGNCEAFVFPSKHEGFGLPVLEAMMHGKAVIASNTSSLPEIVGRDDALFDPRDRQAISNAIHRLLTDADYCASLEAHSFVKAREFSWDQCAQTAWSAIRGAPHRRKAAARKSIGSGKLKLAIATPLPPDKSGIADYSDYLARRLRTHYKVTCVVEKEAERYLGHEVISAEEFEKTSAQFDRIVYNVGNSHFHSWMLKTIRSIPGAVTLHDFHFGGAVATDAVAWDNNIFDSHGFSGVHQRSHGEFNSTIESYPCALRLLQGAVGVLAHSTAPLEQASQTYRDVGVLRWKSTPMPRAPLSLPDREAARAALGFCAGDFVVASFGIMGPTKLCGLIVSGWVASTFAKDPNARLVFVGHGGNGFGPLLLADAHQKGVDNISVTGWMDEATYLNYLAACDAAVQLRVKGRGEVSAALLDCFGAGLPVIVNNGGSATSLPDEICVKVNAEPTDNDIAHALERFKKDAALRSEVGRAAKRHFDECHASDQAIDRFVTSIEVIYADARPNVDDAIKRIAPRLVEAYGVQSLANAAAMLARSIPQPCEPARVLVEAYDIDEQGPGRETLLALLCSSSPGVRFEAFRFDAGGTFHLERKSVLRALDCWEQSLNDERSTPRGDDIIVLRRDLKLYTEQDLELLKAARLQGARLAVLAPEARCGAPAVDKWRSCAPVLSMIDIIFTEAAPLRDAFAESARPDVAHILLPPADAAARAAQIADVLRTHLIGGA